ncbi:MAG: c-di-GMP-related signal transduction protein [Paraglaciecola sp.]|jgi:c-di-GMP-related signal transduction protein
MQVYNELGYKLALDDDDFTSKWDPLLPYVHFIKVDITEHSLQYIAANMAKLKTTGGKLVAECIETKKEFDCFSEMGFHYFQGHLLPSLKSSNINYFLIKSNYGATGGGQ